MRGPAVLVACLAGLAIAASPAAAEIHFVSPADGAALTGPNIPVQIEVNEPGCWMAPSKGSVSVKFESTPTGQETIGTHEIGKSDGSPETFSGAIMDAGNADGYGTFVMHPELFCSENGGTTVKGPTITITLTAPGSPTPTPGPAPTPSTKKCMVPKLTGLGLVKATKRAKAAGCTLVVPSGKRHGKYVVKSTTPKAGTVLAYRAKVHVTLRRKRG